MSPREPAQVYSYKKHGMAFLTLFAVIVTLFSSLAVRASLLSYTTDHHRPISAIPTSAPQSVQTSSPPTAIPTSRITPTPVLTPTANPSPTSTSTPVPVSPYPNIATSYMGTLLDIPTGATTSIRQQQGNISGYRGCSPFEPLMIVPDDPSSAPDAT